MPEVRPGDTSILSRTAASRHRRRLSQIFVEGGWRSQGGMNLRLQVNFDADGVRAAGIDRWAGDRLVSIAGVACGTCRAIEAHRLADEPSYPCLVRNLTTRRQGENCILCKVKKQSCSYGEEWEEESGPSRVLPFRTAAMDLTNMLNVEASITPDLGVVEALDSLAEAIEGFKDVLRQNNPTITPEEEEQVSRLA